MLLWELVKKSIKSVVCVLIKKAGTWEENIEVKWWRARWNWSPEDNKAGIRKDGLAYLCQSFQISNFNVATDL